MRPLVAQLVEEGLSGRVQVVAVIVTFLAFVVVLELVRRRRLVERYALLWMAAAVALLVLAVWRDLLDIISTAVGVAFPPNALFLMAFAVVFMLLLHFSVAISRLSEEAKILAQETARLDEELRRERGSSLKPGARPPDAGAQPEGSRSEAADRGGAEDDPASSNLSDTDQ